MQNDTVKWLMAESAKRLAAFKADPNDTTLAHLREIQARLQVEIRIIDRRIAELGGQD